VLELGGVWDAPHATNLYYGSKFGLPWLMRNIQRVQGGAKRKIIRNVKKEFHNRDMTHIRGTQFNITMWFKRTLLVIFWIRHWI
jgi:hypothetical protein